MPIFNYKRAAFFIGLTDFYLFEMEFRQQFVYYVQLTMLSQPFTLTLHYQENTTFYVPQSVILACLSYSPSQAALQVHLF
jgi:hypothetical protein